MPDDIHSRMEARTARHLLSFEDALGRAHARARKGAARSVQALYALFRGALPTLPELTITETPSEVGLPALLFRFDRADGERRLALTPLRFLEPRESFANQMSPYAVLGLQVRGNTSEVQIGYLTLELAGRTAAELQAEEPELRWTVVHLVCEADPNVDRALAQRLVERAFLSDS